MKSAKASALQTLIQIEKDTRDFGFDWESSYQIIDQAEDECREIRRALELSEGGERIQEEIGDLIHAAISLCLYAGFDVEETLDKVNHKFGRRMDAVKILTEQNGLSNLKGQSWDFMMSLWQQAKKAE